MLLPYLTGAELKVLLYVVRRTFGFKKDADAISLKQLTNGITTRDGRRLDRGTGMPASSVIRARDSLLARGILLAEKHTGPDGGDETTTYRLRMRGDRPELRPATPPDLQNTTPPDLQNASPQTSKMEPSGLAPRNSQETAQETVQQQDPTPLASSNDFTRYSAFLAGVVLDHARELGVGGRGPASVGEILSLWQASGLDESAFATRLHEARATVRKAQRPGVDKWRAYLAAVRAGG